MFEVLLVESCVLELILFDDKWSCWAEFYSYLIMQQSGFTLSPFLFF